MYFEQLSAESWADIIKGKDQGSFEFCGACSEGPVHEKHAELCWGLAL